MFKCHNYVCSGVGIVAESGGDPRNGERLIEAMKNVTFMGASGFVKLDQKGDRYNDAEVTFLNQLQFALDSPSH